MTIGRTYLRSGRAVVTVLIVTNGIGSEEGTLYVHRFDDVAGERSRCNALLRIAARQCVGFAMGLAACHFCDTYVLGCAGCQNIELRPGHAELRHVIAADIFGPRTFAGIYVLRRGRELSCLSSQYDFPEVAVHVHRNLHPGRVVFCSDDDSGYPASHLSTLLQVVVST